MIQLAEKSLSGRLVLLVARTGRRYRNGASAGFRRLVLGRHGQMVLTPGGA